MIDTLLGLDIGTTSTKAVLFDLAGAEIARETSRPYQIHSPRPGWVEQDPEEIWQAVLATIRGVLAKNNSPVNVLALCMAAQSGSLLPVDAQGDPVYALITWMDGRTSELVQQWKDDGLQSQVKSISGWSLYPGLCLPTVAWLQQHNPEVVANASTYFSVNDFITHRLTGIKCTNPSNAGGMQLIDVRRGKWSQTLCAIAGITTSQLSPIKPSSAVIGRIKPELCKLTGLSSEAILVNGGHDQGCTALGLGITSPGKLLLACGTAWVITGVTTPTELHLVTTSLDLNYHPVPERWTISQSLGGLGASLEWWANQAWQSSDRLSGVARGEIFSALDVELSETKAGGEGLCFLPLTGGHSGPATTQRGGFVGLQLSHSRADMARAILESAGFELRWALESIVSAGLPVDRFWMVGGAASSPLWPTILADITGLPISMPQYDDWPALGAAILAGLGAGVFETIEEGLSRFHKPSIDIIPDETYSSLYEHGFRSYKQHVLNNIPIHHAN